MGGAGARVGASDTASVLGIDLGGTSLRLALGDARGTVLAEVSETTAGLTSHAFVGRVAALAAELGAVLGAVGVGVPAPTGRDGRVGAMVNAPALSAAPLRALLEEALGVPVTVENDVNLAALAEQRHGRGRGVQDMVFIGVGTGVGMGIISGGAMVRGAFGGAGELGILPLSVDRVATDLGELGPLESIAGGAGLAAHWTRHTGAPATGRDVFAAAGAGDAVALALLDEQARALAMGVRSVQAILDPRLVVFGGGMGSRPNVVERVRAVLAAQALPAPEIAISELGERAGVIGALEAALDLDLHPDRKGG
jgi:glucokinase